MPETKKRPVIKPKSSVRMMKHYKNRKPDDEGVVMAGSGSKSRLKRRSGKS